MTSAADSPAVHDRQRTVPSVPDGVTLLRHLLGDLTPAEFLRSHYLRMPLRREGTALAWSAVVDDLLVRRLLGAPACDVAMARGGRVLAVPRPDSAEALGRHLGAGRSCVFRHVERHSPAVARHAAAMTEVLPGTVDAHVLCQPAGTYNRGWHCVPDEVFIIQAHGRELHLLRGNPASTPSTQQAPSIGNRPAVAMEADLRAGDWLYIPGGWWHAAVALEDSLSLSLGIRACSAADLLTAVADGMVGRRPWQDRLPPLGTASVWERDMAPYRAILAETCAACDALLGDPVKLAGVLRGLLQRQQPISPTARAADDRYPEADPGMRPSPPGRTLPAVHRSVHSIAGV